MINDWKDLIRPAPDTAYGVLGLVSYTLLRFEPNVRSATILEFVGAGGIGYLIFD